MVDEATHMTPFGGWEKAVNMVYMRTVLLCGLVHNLHKTTKAEVGHFTAPYSDHTTQFQIFQIERVIGGTQLVSELPMPCLALMANAGMHPCQRTLRLPPMARAPNFPCQGAIGLAQLSERRTQWLGGMKPGAIAAGEKGLQPKVQACAFTRHGSGNGLVIAEAGKDDQHMPGWQAFDGQRFDGALDMPGLVKPIEPSKQPQAVPAFVAPAGLCQGNRAILRTWAKCGRTFILFAKKLLIALINTPDNVLDGLRIKLTPVSKARHGLQARHMPFQTKIADVAFETSIVAFLHGNQVVRDLGCQVNPGVQMAEPLATIELKDKGTPRHLHAFLACDIALYHFHGNSADRRDELRTGPLRLSLDRIPLLYHKQHQKSRLKGCSLKAEEIPLCP